MATMVVWTLSLMSTITAEAIGLTCRWYTIRVEPVDLLTVMSSVMLFVALISGTITLGLIPVVLRVAKTRPPPLILKVAIVAGCLPIGTIALQYITQA